MLKLFERMKEFHFHILRTLLSISILALSIGLEHSQFLLAVIPITLAIFIQSSIIQYRKLMHLSTTSL